MQQLQSNWWCLLIFNFLVMSHYNLWYILSAAVTDFNSAAVEWFYVNCLLEGNMCLLIAKRLLPRLFLHLNWKVYGTKWFSLFFLCCYFAANLIVCIAVLGYNHIFSILFRNLNLIVQIYEHLKNFWITFHWRFE